MEVNILPISLLTTVVWVLLNVASYPLSAETNEPIIFVTFPRWENRTFSPRVYYLMMQKYGLTEKLLDVNNEYHRYLTESELQPPNPPVNIVFKSIPKKPNVVPPEVAGRTALRILRKKNGLLSVRTNEDHHRSSIALMDTKNPDVNESTPWVYPSVPPLHVSNFFTDRIAYPGSSSRNKNVKPNPSQLVSAGIFDTTESSSKPNFTSDDVIDTVSLLVDIIKYSHWNDQNAVISPFSITNILALLFLGSNGTTYDELGNQLKRQNPLTSSEYSSRELRFHSAFRNLLNFLNRGTNQTAGISICNRIISDKKFPFRDSYRQDAIYYYDAQSDTFDFERQAGDVTNKVNKWIDHKTKGAISSILDSPPSPETTVILLNAIYFKGDWEVPFIKELNQKKPFYVTPRETLEVTMMTNLLNVPYIETDHFIAIGIPYRSKTSGIFIMLPTNPGVKGLTEMERKLTPETLKKFHAMKLSQVTVQLPKMRLESEAQVKDLLSNFGLSSMFSPNTANFTRMSPIPGLYVSSVLHKSIFEMNEYGVTAAAVTVATGDRTLDDRPITFTANRPFSFIIWNIKAKTVLFYGRVTRPLALND